MLPATSCPTRYLPAGFDARGARHHRRGARLPRTGHRGDRDGSERCLVREGRAGREVLIPVIDDVVLEIDEARDDRERPAAGRTARRPRTEKALPAAKTDAYRRDHHLPGDVRGASDHLDARSRANVGCSRSTPTTCATGRRTSTARTDDYPYGGGPGMVMKPEPVFEAVERRPGAGGRLGPRGLPGSRGEASTRARATRLAAMDRMLLVCGRYEGFDERALSLADEALRSATTCSPAASSPRWSSSMRTARLLPGVLGDDDSATTSPSSDGLLEYPQYTRPAEFAGMVRPEVLLSGDHARIAAWRREQSIRRTAQMRPDLLEGAELTDDERRMLAEETEEEPRMTEPEDFNTTEAPATQTPSPKGGASAAGCSRPRLMVLLAFAPRAGHQDLRRPAVRHPHGLDGARRS